MTYTEFKAIIDSKEPIHICGINGVSMRALAKELCSMGATVQGSDRDPSPYLEEFESLGIRFMQGHDVENTAGSALVIRTAAVLDNNPDIVGAKSRNTPILERANAWGMLMSRYEQAVCVAGTHGKTSTTSMIATFTQSAGCDPTVMVGGNLSNIGGSLRIGSDKLFIAEACEYKNSFLSFTPTIAIILNIDRDHLDFFSDTDDIIASFTKFAYLVPEQTGVVIACLDDINTVKAVKDINRRVITFGTTPEADYYMDNVASHDGFYSFDVIHNGEVFTRIDMNVPGMHNARNAVAAAIVADLLKVEPEAFKKGIEEYRGVGRRFEYRGDYNGAKIFDDYAHHPSEIEATLKAAADMNPNRVVCIFQPHTYSRTVSLLNEFADALSHCDVCVLTEIFAARETNFSGITSQKLSNMIKDSICVPTLDAAADFIIENAQPGDIIFTMGAGDINKVYNILVDKTTK
ncbi:MAG: UDP-N-acetylmuramate--L-alanine ligase [Clostridia bacterium]|nr:UDP-N-acetylmuramate--L-alanine ligase [Clostridia bacterium]MBQ5813002.1 UDP-N-acetylmuramate--L-alanine ligase [Clostridia bacterium]